MILIHLINIWKDAGAGRDQYKNKFFENMEKYNCVLLYGSSSRYAYDTYQSEFTHREVKAIYQANEWY